MPYDSNADLPPAVRERYSERCQSVFRRVWNDTFDASGSEGRAFRIAHTAAANCMGSRAMELSTVKFVDQSDSIVRGFGMPFGGPVEGRDFDGEFFSARTDFMFDWLKGERPLIYQHGLDADMDDEVVGSVVEYSKRDEGIWTLAQLDLRARYIDGIRELVDKGALSFSSGAYPSLVRIDRKSGEIMRWPWVELSLTPTPANPYAVATKSARRMIYVPGQRRVLTVGKAAWSAQFINDLPDSAFACIDAAGRHYPHHGASGELDLPHLRAALSRIGDPSNVQCGADHLHHHARAAGVGET